MSNQKQGMNPETSIMEKWISARTKAMSKMLDNPYSNGIYRTSDFFDTIDEIFMKLFKEWHNSLAQGGEGQAGQELEKVLITLMLVTRHARNVGYSVSPNSLRAEAVMAERFLENTLGEKEKERLEKIAFT